jgi:hypothetical protein
MDEPITDTELLEIEASAANIRGRVLTGRSDNAVFRLAAVLDAVPRLIAELRAARKEIEWRREGFEPPGQESFNPRDFPAIDITGGVDAVEYIRQMRDGDSSPAEPAETSTDTKTAAAGHLGASEAEETATVKHSWGVIPTLKQKMCTVCGASKGTLRASEPCRGPINERRWEG